MTRHRVKRMKSSVIDFPNGHTVEFSSSDPVSARLSCSYAPTNRLALLARSTQTTPAYETENRYPRPPRIEALLDSLFSAPHRTPGARHPEEFNAASSESRRTSYVKHYHGAIWGYKRYAPGELFNIPRPPRDAHHGVHCTCCDRPLSARDTVQTWDRQVLVSGRYMRCCGQFVNGPVFLHAIIRMTSKWTRQHTGFFDVKLRG